MEEEFEDDLAMFAHYVGIFCALEQGGKFTQEEAYKRIKKLWKSLKKSKKRNLDSEGDLPEPESE